MRLIKTVIVLSLILFLGGTVSAQNKSSASYIIPSEVMGSSGGERTSASYSVFDVLSGLTLGSGSSVSYAMREGFIPPAFPALAVLVSAIDPSSGYNTGSINITDLQGSGFLSGAGITLSRTGEADITASNVNVESSTNITCTFDLTGARTGLWNVVVTNPDSQSSTLPSAFNVRTWATQTLAVNSPNPFNPLSGPTTIIYQLAADAETAVLIFNISHELIHKQDFASGANGGRAGNNSISWNGYSHSGEMAANGVYFLRVVDRKSGRILVKGKIAVSR